MADSVPNNLPLQLSSFIGREREIAEVKQLLTSARLVTLTGAGGCGKTRLALKIGGDVASQRLYDHGMWLVALASLADPALVPQQVATALEVREQTNQPLLTTLTNFLRDKHLLLILDNCEHLIEPCAQLVEALLQACPNFSVLATSRERLNVDGEQVYLVPSLAIPNPKNQIPTAELAQNESVRLFVARAQAAQANFELTEKNATAIVHMCQRLDGIPLAIELAAARVPSMSVEQIAAHLDMSLDLLSGGKRTSLPRQQTMRFALDWSYALLSEPERALFRRLSVFAGGWTLEAEAVTSEPSTVNGERSPLFTVHRLPFTDLLSQLVNKSLVVAESRQGETRYRMLEPTRQYANEKLEESGESASMCNNHLGFFRQWAELAERQFKGPDQPEWANRLETELDNIRAALYWARAGGQIDEGVQLAIALMYYWDTGGYQREVRDKLETFLTHPDLAQRTATRAKALIGAGWLAGEQGDVILGNVRLVESVTFWREWSDKRWLAFALRTLGFNLHAQLHDWRDAQQILEESAALSREIEDKWGLAMALRYLGNMPDLDYARRCLEESLTLFRDLRGPWGISAALTGLGRVCIQQGQYAESNAYLKEALALRRTAKDKAFIGYVLKMLGDIAMFQGNWAEARLFFEESIQRRHEIGDTWTPTPLHRLGQIALREGDLTKGIRLSIESLALNRKTNDIAGMSASLAALAAIAMTLGNTLEAVRLFGAIESLFEKISSVIHSYDSKQYEQNVSIARSKLSSAAFEKAWAEGRALTLKEAIALAEQLAADEHSAITPTPPQTGFPAGLTAREVEVLQWLAKGLSDAEIAVQLVISPRTVNGHLRSIYSKLDVTSRTAAIRVALDLKLL